MNSELEGYQDQFVSIKQDAPGIVARLTEEQFNRRPAGGGWSIAECFDHLNVTARLFVPSIEACIAEARAAGMMATGPFTYSLFQRIVLWSMEPPPRFRQSAPKHMRPTAAQRDVSVTMADFQQWQDRFIALVRQADGIDLRRARHVSPAAPVIKWSLGATFAITLAHERRHLWQARRIRNSQGF
jgi:DinB superfamily